MTLETPATVEGLLELADNLEQNYSLSKFKNKSCTSIDLLDLPIQQEQRGAGRAVGLVKM